MFQAQSVSSFIPAVYVLWSALSFKGHHVRYILLSSHPHRASGFLLSKSRARVDACYRFQVHCASDSHKAKPCLLKRNLWPWQLWYSWTFLMVKCLWFYIIKTIQPWKYLLKCFKIYYNYWFMDGQNEKNHKHYEKFRRMPAALRLCFNFCSYLSKSHWVWFRCSGWPYQSLAVKGQHLKFVTETPFVVNGERRVLLLIFWYCLSASPEALSFSTFSQSKYVKVTCLEWIFPFTGAGGAL